VGQRQESQRPQTAHRCDTTGLVLAVVVTAASVQDRDGARPLLWNLRRACAKVSLVWADAGYAAGKLAAWAAALTMTIEIVARRDRHTFEVLPRRWVVERTFAWISKHRRTVRSLSRWRCRHQPGRGRACPLAGAVGGLRVNAGAIRPGSGPACLGVVVCLCVLIDLPSGMASCVAKRVTKPVRNREARLPGRT
jgi:transposase